MKTYHKVFPGKDLVVLTASGTLDLQASKAAIKKLAADPDYEEHYEVLIDLRDVECEMSVMDVYEIAAAMAWPDPALPTRRKIAVLVSGQKAFDRAKFLELCASNRGLLIGAFVDYEDADKWLDADLPEDDSSKSIVSN